VNSAWTCPAWDSLTTHCTVAGSVTPPVCYCGTTMIRIDYAPLPPSVDGVA
jgi:hypothetical protein